ncbi:MAG: inositol oxygenase [Acidobacteria bacterium]|nr:inositol oxygenase [Acidobacteriota bacterium]
MSHAISPGPLQSVEQWDDFVKSRYRPDRKKEEFRVFDASSPQVVKDFYRENHAKQTLDFVLAKEAGYQSLKKGRMGIWEALEKLEALVDDSDPDTDLTQMEHNYQTAEAIRKAGHPRWMILTGFIHDMGKVLCLYGEPQWAVVGDTFPVGCAWSDSIVFHNYFEANPDRARPELQTPLGIYQQNGGLNQVHLSFGHDEYLYYVTRPYLPEPAQYIIRYHSFYPAHREGAYDYLMNCHDREMFEWVRKFNPFDLYSKSDTKPDVNAIRPFYEELVSEFFPKQIDW